MIDTEHKDLDDHPYRSSFFYGWPGVLLGSIALLGGGAALWFAIPLFRAEEPDEWAMGLAILSYVTGGLGLYLVPQGVREIATQRRAREAERGAQRWRSDYSWNPRGIRSANVREVVWSASIVLWLLPAIVALNTLLDVGTVQLNVFIVAADLAIVIGIGFTLHRVLRLFRHGTSFLAFDRFPFRPGEAIDVHLRPPESARLGEILSVELRFVEECFGDARQAEMVVERTYSDKREVHIEPGSRAAADIPISIPLPVDRERVTRMLARPPCHWELCVTSQVSGVDFEALFLVPVYEG